MVDFLAEEPNEFGLSCIGSRGITGYLTSAHLALTNAKNETLAQALGRVGGDPARLGGARRTDIKAAFELHIEQGPVLESEGIDVGLVSAIVGITRLEIEFQGSAGSCRYNADARTPRPAHCRRTHDRLGARTGPVPRGARAGSLRRHGGHNRGAPRRQQRHPQERAHRDRRAQARTGA
jgi:hypothetical protein